MKKIGRWLLYVSAFSMFIVLISAGILWTCLRIAYHLPPQSRVREYFVANRDVFVKSVATLRSDRPPGWIITDEGAISTDGIHETVIPRYRDLIRKTESQFILIENDGSIKFSLWGYGGAIMDDSYMGIYYSPKDHGGGSAGWDPVVVKSLADESLPHEDGRVADGLYIVAIEPEWFIYRFEYRE